jgi:sigma-B regulation protein RsbU (phosphoserine phosphatase)
VARQTPDDHPEARSARDQLAGDRDLAAGLDPRVHDLSRDVHDRTDRQRERTTLRRETSAHARLSAADARDAAAVVRDAAALARDLAAHARGVAMAELDATAQRVADARPLTGTDVIMHAARNRKQAAQRRVKAAEQRELAAQDRLDAAADRQDAARERMHAFSDREALLTELEREQERRAEALRYQHRAEELARTLQRSLSPPRLPRIAGLDVAAHHEPSAPEEVGGDFYDLFPLGAGRTAFFLGDVCGKGPQAAAVTSLARYTMRTAAMLHETPEAILSDLNTALLMEAEDQAQTCTAVYGEIDARATSITLAVAGHPPPLIVRVGGVIETTLAHGTMLGVLDDPVFHTCELTLGPGDAVVICSDGILDTEIDATRVDEQRIADLLSGAMQFSAQALVHRLMDALRANTRPLRDDIAILVLRRAPAG